MGSQKPPPPASSRKRKAPSADSPDAGIGGLSGTLAQIERELASNEVAIWMDHEFAVALGDDPSLIGIESISELIAEIRDRAMSSFSAEQVGKLDRLRAAKARLREAEKEAMAALAAME